MWLVFAALYGAYDGVMYAMFDWRKGYYLAGRIHVPHVLAWLVRAVVALGIFWPREAGWVAFLLDLAGAALTFALLHTGIYGVTRRALDVPEYGFFMHVPGWGGWVSLWPDRNFWVRLAMAIGGLSIWVWARLN